MATEEYTKEQLTALLKRCADNDTRIAFAAQAEMSKAMEIPLREGIMNGDILNGIFAAIDFSDGRPIEFPLDVLQPGTEKDQVAYTIPNHGYIPQRTFEGDYVQIPTYRIASSADWLLEHAKYGRWDIVGRIMGIMEAHFVVKMNNDGWRTLLYAGVDRNAVIYDSDAGVGQFTKRLISLMMTAMRRNGGGNSGSYNRRKLTHLYVSPENKEDMRNWGIDQVDEVTRREIFVGGDGSISKIFNVFIEDLDELGEGQEFQLYFTNELGGALASTDVELVVGLDRSGQGYPFVMPVRDQVQVFDDPTMHRSGKEGHYGWCRVGFAALDNRYILLGSN